MATINTVTAVAIVTNKPNAYNNFSFGISKNASIVAPSHVSSKSVTGGVISLKCKTKHFHEIPAGRRSGNYKPPLWDFDYIQSLSTQYTDERYMRRASELVVEVKKLLEEDLMEPVQQLEFIDDLQRMGISYHFNEKIEHILKSMHNDHRHKYDSDERDLYSTALEFRLLRQHGFSISQDLFDCFKNEKGEFKARLNEDTRGLLQLYEASFLLVEGEETLEQAKEFATNFLQKKLDYDGISIDENLSSLVRHALELPIHWRTQKINARWFIDAYGKRPDMNPVVLELAKLDFNILQATYQQELKLVSRWWKQTRLAENLPFARDRLVECYFWTIGWLFEPGYGYSRIMLTKLFVLITVIDDIFDVYGTWEELQIFNNAIQRCEIEAMDQLPHYMQMCYLAVNNFINEIAYDVLTNQGFLITPHIRKSWADLCISYLQEAKWYYSGYTPTLDEYINNAWISISAPLILSHTYFLVTNPIEEEVVRSFYKDRDVVRCSAMILRLADDLGTSPFEMKRGDVPKAIECYMNENGATKEDAQEYIKFLICEAWKKMNQEQVANSSFPQFFVKNAADLGRTAQYIYQHGDGFGIQNTQIKERISTLLFEPICLP